MAIVNRLVKPLNSVLLVVGKDDFQPPGDFGGQTCVATDECIAIGVVSVDDVPTSIGIASGTEGPAGLHRLGTFVINTAGRLSVRSVLGDEYDGLSVQPGIAAVTVWADDSVGPSLVALRVVQE